MNLELIIKLARLANENPNENEANLAARKVCQLIKAAKYKFNGTPQPQPQPSRPAEPVTWNDVRRSAEPQWSSKPPVNPGVDFDPFEFLRDYANRQGWDRGRGRPFNSWFDEGPRYTEKEIFVEEFDNTRREYILSNGHRISEMEFQANPKKYKVRPGAERKNKDKGKRKLKCRGCGDYIDTAFVGPDELFTCITCIWKSYQEKKGEATS